jgi:UDP-N-acetylglucosamine:LPS N-acetylglucosamine transferase
MFSNRKMAIVIGAGGGHLTEALLATNDLMIPRTIVTFKLPHTDSSLCNEICYYVIDPHKDFFKFLLNAVQSLFIVLKVRPCVVINTGGGISIACSLLAKMLGARLVFIESGARVRSPSRTGKFLYRFSDLFIVQWKSLLSYYPDAIYGGTLI